MKAARNNSALRGLVMLVAGSLATSALAATSAPSTVAAPAAPAPASAPMTKSQLAAWLAKNTDLAEAQVAIAGARNVYSVEPLGPRMATGEVMALVRTEVVAADWGTAHGFRSWDAHILFDCSNGRMRVLRSTSYSDLNRKGTATSENANAEWFAPKPEEPAARLIAAACDPGFAWPLRVNAVVDPAQQPQDTKPATEVAAAPPVAPAPAPRSAKPEVVAAAAAPAQPPQIAKPATEVAAAAPVAPAPAPRSAKPEVVAAAAAPAQPPQIVKPATEVAAAAPAVPAPAPRSAKLDAVAAPVAPAQPSPADLYAVQVARGPVEAGAKRALAKARTVLSAQAAGLTDVTEESRIGHHKRYTALLSGFSSAQAARDACAALTKAGRSCVTRRLDDAAPSRPAPEPAPSKAVIEAAAPAQPPQIAKPATEVAATAPSPASGGYKPEAATAATPALPVVASALVSGPKAVAAAPAVPTPPSTAEPSTPQVVQVGVAPAATASPAELYAVQVARGPIEVGAKRALAKARAVLQGHADGLTDVTEETQLGHRKRYTALLGGFATAQAAQEACAALTKAGQSCVPRRLDGAAPSKPAAQPAVAAENDAPVAPRAPHADGKQAAYVVQIAYGPSEAGAKRALLKAREALGRKAEGLSASTETTWRGHRRVAAVLAGFPDATAAAETCKLLSGLGPGCLARVASEPHSVVAARLW
jgi:hypothetical protein